MKTQEERARYERARDARIERQLADLRFFAAFRTMEERGKRLLARLPRRKHSQSTKGKK